MRRIRPGIVLLVAAQAAAGGWAFMELLKPGNVLQLLQAFSMC